MRFQRAARAPSAYFHACCLTFLLLLTSSPTTVSATKTVIDLVSSDPGFSLLIRELQHHRLIPFLNNRKTCTFFAPTNEAFNKFQQENQGRVSREMLLYHILPDNYMTSSFKNEMLLETALVKEGYLGENREGQLVAVSKPSWRPGRRNKLLVGDAELLEKDWVADNGVVHVVDRLLIPPKDLVETMKQQPELSVIYNIVHNAGLDDLLRQHRPFTLFAPTTEAVQNLKDVQVQYLRHPQGRHDLELTFHHHIHSGTLYKEDIPQGATGVSTLEGQDLMVYSDGEDGKKTLSVDNAQVERTDILAANGVIHTVARPLLPSALVWTAAKYLVGLNATRFVERVREAGMSHLIDDPEASFTIFAPQDDTFGAAMTMENGLLKKDPNDVLRFHFVKGKKPLAGFQDGQLLKTELITAELNGGAQRSKVSVKQDRKRTVVLIDGVEIKGEPVQVGKSIIYLLTRPLSLPLPLIKRLRQEESLAGYMEALAATGLDRRLSDARAVTVFAPSLEGWAGLGVVSDYLLMKQASSLGALEAVTRYAIVEDDVYYSEALKSGRSVLKTSEGSDLVIEKKGDVIYVGEGRLDRADQVGGRITEKDILVESGVVHTISAVPLPPTLSITLYNVLQGAGTTSFLQAFETSNITGILTDWNKDFTIFAPTDDAFKKAGLEGALNDKEFVARLVRLHVIPGRVLRLEEDLKEEGASLLNEDARLVVRDVTGEGEVFGVRVKGARSRKEARVVGFGNAHPAWPLDDTDGDHEEGVVGRRVREGLWNQGTSAAREYSPYRHVRNQHQQPDTPSKPQSNGVVYVIDRVLLPGDPDPLSGAWFWIGVVLLALVGTLLLCGLTAFSVHALIAEIRELEGRAAGYSVVPTQEDDEEAAIEGREVAVPEEEGHGANVEEEGVQGLGPDRVADVVATGEVEAAEAIEAVNESVQEGSRAEN